MISSNLPNVSQKLMNKITPLLGLFLIVVHAKAQDFREQRRDFIATNVGINGVIGGVGALTNIKKDERPVKVFVKGFAQGCLGGAFTLIGKDLTYQIKSRNNLGYAWPARLTNSIGNSITQNAASNSNFWERWHFNLGLVRFDYAVTANKFQARFFPSSLYGVMVAGRQGTFSLKRSLQTGILVFERNGFVTFPFGNNQPFGGIGIVSSIAINKNIRGGDFYDLMAHETMHILQYDNMIWVNPFFNKLDTKWKAKSEFYRTAGNYVYFDLNGLTIFALYYMQVGQPWDCRWLEREAEHFSRRILMPKCD
jgi:hypothetical protein